MYWTFMKKRKKSYGIVPHGLFPEHFYKLSQSNYLKCCSVPTSRSHFIKHS